MRNHLCVAPEEDLSKDVEMDKILTRQLEPFRPTVLCIPGTLMSPIIFDDFVCPEQFQWSAVSWMNGSGPWSLDAVSTKITTLIEQFNLPKVVLVGHSFGGAISIMTASKCSQIKGMVLSNTGANTASHGDPDYPKKIVEKWGVDLRRHQVRRCFVLEPDPGLLQKLDAYADTCSRDATLEAATSLRSVDLAPLLKQIDCPVLIAHGELDSVRTANDVKVLQEGLANSSVVLLRAGHTPMVEAKDEWNSSTLSWLTATF